MKIGDCPECLMYYYSPRGGLLRDAASNVAIETGKTSTELLVAVLSEYHANGHKEPDDDQPAPR